MNWRHAHWHEVFILLLSNCASWTNRRYFVLIVDCGCVSKHLDELMAIVQVLVTERVLRHSMEHSLVGFLIVD